MKLRTAVVSIVTLVALPLLVGCGSDNGQGRQIGERSSTTNEANQDGAKDGGRRDSNSEDQHD